MPLLWLSLVFLAGILLGNALLLSITTWLILAGIFMILAVMRRAFKSWNIPHLDFLDFNHPFFTSNLPISIPVFLIVLCLGAARYQSKLPDLRDPGFISAYNNLDQQMMVTGVVAAMPEVRDSYTSLRVHVETMHPVDSLNYTEVDGLVMVRTSPDCEARYGDRVVVRGYLTTPPENEAFSYREYLARQGIYTIMSNAKVSTLETGQGNWFMSGIFKLKEKSLETVYRLWPDPEASLLAGILLGVETNIPEPVQQAFQETGTSHIIAISGFNITIIAGLFATVFGKLLNRRKGAIIAAIAISLYTILVGAAAAVVRAAIMGGLALFACQVGRRQQGINSLAITAAVMSWFAPNIPWDVSFQLSFAATLGLVLYAEPMTQAFTRLASRWLPADKAEALAKPVGEFLLFTFAAQVTTLPIMAYHFGSISWVAFLANPAILPVQPPIMILGGLSLILGLIWYPLGNILAVFAWPFVLFTIRVVEFFGNHTRGSLSLGEFSLVWVILFYTFLLSVTFGWSRLRSWFTTHHERLKESVPGSLIVILGILAVVVWRVAWTAPDGRLQLTLLEVGTGDAILIRTPEGRYALVNGGSSTSLLSDNLGRRLPPFQHELDWLVVASPRSEQVAGLPRLIEQYSPTWVLWAGLPSASREADYLRGSLTARQIPVIPAEVGNALDLGKGASMKVLTTGNRGAILLLEWERFRALLPLGLSEGDLDSLGMGIEVGPVSVLLLADNGYAPANPPAWIANLNPQLVLLSVAPDDRDGLPDRETLAAICGYTLLRTDQNGWIQVTTDGQQMWVEAER